jgi:hypothetical protein
MKIELRDAAHGSDREISQVWVDEKSVVISGVTLPQLLDFAVAQGWRLDHATMWPQQGGATVSYFYQR